MAYIEELVRKEKEDRIESLETQLVPIRSNIKALGVSIEQERQ